MLTSSYWIYAPLRSVYVFRFLKPCVKPFVQTCWYIFVSDCTITLFDMSFFSPLLPPLRRSVYKTYFEKKTWNIDFENRFWTLTLNFNYSFRNYEGCQQFYNGVNKLNLLETLRPNEWLDRLQPPIKNAERDFVKEGKRFQYLPLETVLRERPELVWKFYDSLFTHDVLSKKENLLRMVTDVVRNLPDSQFYEWVTVFSVSLPVPLKMILSNWWLHASWVIRQSYHIAAWTDPAKIKFKRHGAG